MDIFPKHMMATRAVHKTTDISRDQESLAIIQRQDPHTGNYIGNWAFDKECFGVEFDPQTTRDLTPQEVLSIDGYNIQYSQNQTPPALDQKDSLDKEIPNIENALGSTCVENHIDHN